MGKTKKARNNKKKRSTKHVNESKTAAHSTDNTSEGEIDGKKTEHQRDNRSTGDIQAAGYSPQESMKVEKKSKKDNTRSTYNVRITEQGSDSVNSDLKVEELKEIIGESQESMGIHVNFHEKKDSEDLASRRYMLDSLTNHQRDLKEFFTSQHLKLDEHSHRYRKMLKYRHNLGSSTEDTLTAVAKSEAHEEIGALKQLEDDGNKNIATTSSGVDDPYELITDLEKDEDKKEKKSNDKDVPSDDAQKAMHSPQKAVEGKKCERDYNKCTDNILTSGHSPQIVDGKKERIKSKDNNRSTGGIRVSHQSTHRMESDYTDEAIMDNIDEIARNVDKADFPEIKHSKEMAKNVSSEECLTSQRSKNYEQMNKCLAIGLALRFFKEKYGDVSSEKETSTTVAKVETDERRISKEVVDHLYDLFKEFQKVNSKKIGKKSKKDSDSSTDCIQADECSPQNVTEGKNNRKKEKKDNAGSNEDIQGFYFDIDTQKSILKNKECMEKEKGIIEVKDSNSMTKCETPEKTKNPMKSKVDFQRGLEEFMTFQCSKLDEQATERRGVAAELEFLKEQRDLLSSDKETVTAVEKTEAHEETSVPTELEYEASNEVRTDDKLGDYHKEISLDLENDDNVHFEFEMNGDKHIELGGKYFFFTEEEKQDIAVDIEDKNIQIDFIGSQIVISTENSEFEISVRKPHPANLTDDATQTDTLQ